MNQDRPDAVPFRANATCAHSPFSSRMSLADATSPRRRRSEREGEREMENVLLGKNGRASRLEQQGMSLVVTVRLIVCKG